MYIYIYICMYIYICVYVYIYIYVYGLVEGLNSKEYPHNSYGQRYGPVRLRTSILGSCNVPPQWCERWFISPSNYSYLRTINHSYWSYVHQLNAIERGPHIVEISHWNIARSRFGGQLGHILPDTSLWQACHLLPESAVCAVQCFFLGWEMHQHGHSTMNGNSINSIKCFFWLEKFNEVWKLWDLYQPWAYQKINEVQWIGLGENHHPKPWLLPSGN